MNYKSNYRIETQGDPFEKIGWNLFVRDKFLNYDVFWANFIAPQTNRDKNPNDIWFKENVDNNVRILSMLHYGIFMHFLYIYQNIGNANNRDVFNYSYIRLSSICDLCEELMIRVLLYTHKVDKTKFAEGCIKNKLEINKTKIEKAINKGQNYSITIFSRISVLKSLYDSTSITKFETLSSEIRAYRNLLIHSWPLFQIDNSVPKKEIVINQDFRDWTKITNILKDSIKSRSYTQQNFIAMQSLLINDTEALLIILNKIWDQVIEFMNGYVYEKQI